MNLPWSVVSLLSFNNNGSNASKTLTRNLEPRKIEQKNDKNRTFTSNFFFHSKRNLKQLKFKTHESSMPFSKSIRSSPFGLATFDVRRIITLLLLLLLLLVSHNLFVDFGATFDSGASGMLFVSILIDAFWWPS